MTRPLRLGCPELASDRREVFADLIETALAAVEPAEAVRRHLTPQVVETLGKSVLVAAGKAAVPMAQAAAAALGPALIQAVVVFPSSVSSPMATHPRVRNIPSSHPVPDELSRGAARAVIDTVRGSGSVADTLVLALSGGATSLLGAPRPGLEVAQMVRLNQMLLRCGASIAQMNCVRRHVLELAGGGLARVAASAGLRGLGLLLSDVVGDDPAVIGSGPLCGDSTTFSEALCVLRDFELDRALPDVTCYLEQGMRGEREETLEPSSDLLARFEHKIVGSGPLAAEATARRGKQLGLDAMVEPLALVGDVEQAAERLAWLAEGLRSGSGSRPALRVLCGETSVRVTGPGRGGRNQELACRVALRLSGMPDVAVLTLATDGVDGPTNAAGALVTGETFERGRRLGLDFLSSLARNDSYTLLDALGCLLSTGPTQTNVADLTFIAAW